MKQLSACNDIGKLQKYVACEIVHDRAPRSVKITQPVLLQALQTSLCLEALTMRLLQQQGKFYKRAMRRTPRVQKIRRNIDLALGNCSI
jgi:hypothetical protein